MIDLLELLEKKPTIIHTTNYFTIEDVKNDPSKYYIGETTTDLNAQYTYNNEFCANGFAFQLRHKFTKFRDSDCGYDSDILTGFYTVAYCYLAIPSDKPWVVHPNIGKVVLEEYAPRTLRFLQRLLEIK